MLFVICSAIFVVSLTALFLLLYYYRNEISEDGFSFFRKGGGESIHELGVKGVISENQVPLDDANKARLMHASRLKISSSSKKSSVPVRREGGVVHMSVVKDSIELLDLYLWECKDRLRHFDGATIEPNAITTKGTADQVIFTRKLVQSLQKRSAFLHRQLEEDSPDYQAIYKEITSPVSFIEDTLHSLISSQETPPIKWDDLGVVVKKLTQDLDIAVRERKRVVRK